MSAQKDLDEEKAPKGFFKDLVQGAVRGGIIKKLENAVQKAKDAVNSLLLKKSTLDALAKEPDPKKKMDGLMQLRQELGLPKIPKEFVKDYDEFQKMAQEGISKKDKSTEVDYQALNKELKEIEASLATAETVLTSLDKGMEYGLAAASAVPGGKAGGLVYKYSKMATNVLSGQQTPQQAGVELATSFVIGKLGDKVLKTTAGQKLIETYAKKFGEKFFSNTKNLKMFVDASTKLASKTIVKGVDKLTGLGKAAQDAANVGINKGAQWLNDGEKWLGENGYALWANTIAPSLQDLSVEAQKQFADGMKAFQEIKTGIMTSSATDFAQGYKRNFKDMYGDAVQTATNQIKKIPGLDGANVDALVTQVTAALEKQFDNAAKTVQDINDKGAGNVLKGFVADLRVVGGDAYEQYLQPSVKETKEGASQLMADGMQMLNEIKTGVMTSTLQDFAKGYKEQFKGLYGQKIEKAKELMKGAVLDKDKGRVDQFVNAVTAGIEKQFDAGVKTAAEMQQKGVATVLKEFSADMGVVAEQGFNDYLKPTIDRMDAKARPHVEVAMRELATLREGALQLLRQNPKQTAQQYVQKVQQMCGPAIRSARVQLELARITPDNARKFLAATVQSVKDGYQKIAARVKEG